MNPEQDIKPLMDEIDSMLAEGGGPPGGPGEPPMDAGAEEAAAPSEAVGDEINEQAEVVSEEPADVQPFVELLGVDEEKAAALYDAAMQMPRFEGMTAQEIAEQLVDDYQLRMQVEAIAAGSEDAAAADAMELPPAGAIGGDMGPMGGM